MIGKKLGRITKTNEFFVLLVILVIFFAVSAISPVFLSSYSIISVLKTAIEPVIYAVGAYLVILSGGIDLTVAGIGAFSMFTATKIVFNMNYEGSALLPYVLAIALGAALGSINGLLISRLKIQPMIATLGLNSIINGVTPITMPGRKPKSSRTSFSILADSLRILMPWGQADSQAPQSVQRPAQWKARRMWKVATSASSWVLPHHWGWASSTKQTWQ